MIGAAIVERAREAAAGTAWWPLAAAGLAGVAGAIGLRAVAPPGLAVAHLVFVIVGLVAGALVATLPERLYRLATALGVGLAIAALPAARLVGPELGGAHRWVAVGPIVVRVAVLFVPVWGEALARLARSRRADLHLGAVAGLLAIVASLPDAPSVVVLAVVAAAASVGARRLGAVVAIGAVASAIALAGHVADAPLPHVEGALARLASAQLGWLVAAGLSLAGAMLASARAALASRGADAGRAAAAAAGLVALVAAPLALGDGGVPWIAFGGSAIVAGSALLGIALRLARARRGTPVAA